MLTTLADLKTRLGISGSTYDVFLQNQINIITEAIESYCRRRFDSKSYIQTFYRGDYRPSQLVELFNFPLVSVASIVEDGETLDEEAYRIHKPTGRIIRTDGTFFWSEETVITYTAGYETIPYTILSALDGLVQANYNKKVSGVDLNFGSDIQRISIPGAISIDFDYTLTNNNRDSIFGNILGNNLNTLDSWRSERAILGSSTLEYVEVVP